MAPKGLHQQAEPYQLSEHVYAQNTVPFISRPLALNPLTYNRLYRATQCLCNPAGIGQSTDVPRAALQFAHC